jgi:predicted PurR-regulated permease PerM
MTAQADQGKGARALIVAASLVIVIAGLKVAAPLILPLLIALFVALICLPLLDWLKRRGIPDSFAIALTVLATLLFLGSVAALVGASFSDFSERAPHYRERLEVLAAEPLAWLEERGIHLSDLSATAQVNPGRIMDFVGATFKGIAGLLSNFLLVVLTVVFILAEAAAFPDKLRNALGGGYNPEHFARLQREIQRYLATKTLMSLTTGATVGVALALIGVDFALVWGVLAFILDYIPNLGSILAAIPPVLLAAVQLGPGHALAVAAVYVVVNMVLGNLVEPQLMGRRLGLSGLVVFVSLVFWGWVWGPVGMLLSVPLTMVIKIMLENTEDLRWVAALLGSSTSSGQLLRGVRRRRVPQR